jgi:cystathionine beta-lyase/cystathionine gamma-synthase
MEIDLLRTRQNVSASHSCQQREQNTTSTSGEHQLKLWVGVEDVNDLVDPRLYL